MEGAESAEGKPCYQNSNLSLQMFGYYNSRLKIDFAHVFLNIGTHTTAI